MTSAEIKAICESVTDEMPPNVMMAVELRFLGEIAFQLAVKNELELERAKL